MTYSHANKAYVVVVVVVVVEFRKAVPETVFDKIVLVKENFLYDTTRTQTKEIVLSAYIVDL